MTWILTFGLLGTTFLLARFLPREALSYGGDIVPSSSPDGAVIPVLFGRVLLKRAHVLWYGDVIRKPVYLSHTTLASAVEHILSFLSLSAPRTPVAYDTYASVHLALCRGTHIHLKAVRTRGGVVLWDGDVDDATIAIDKPYCLGGVGQGGGVKGVASFYGGHQTVGDPYLVAKGLPAVGYRGVSCITFQTTYWGEANVLPSLSFDLAFYPNTLGVMRGIERIGDDANPACVLYFLLTTGTRAIPEKEMDKKSFKDVAKILHEEGNGCSLLLEQTQRYSDILEDVTRQIDGTVITDHKRSLVCLRLHRKPVEGVLLPLLTPDEVVEIRNVSRSSALQTFNQVRVQFWDRDSDWQKKDLLAQDLAHMRLTKSLREVVVTLPGVHRGEQALKWAYHALEELSSFMLKCRLTIGKQGETFLPGDCVRLSWQSYGIENVLLRIHAIERGTPEDGRWILDCLQEKEHQQLFYQQALALPSLNQQPSTSEVALPSAWRVIEAPYWIGKTLVENKSHPQSVLLFLVSPPHRGEGTLAFEGLFDASKVTKSHHLWTPNATLTTDILADAVVSERWIVKNEWDFASLATEETTQWFLVDDEIIAVENIVASNADFALQKVWRGLLDTIPKVHTQGSRVWHLASGLGSNLVEAGNHDVSITTHGYSRSITTSMRPISITGRHLKPYPLVNLSVIQRIGTHTLDVSWKIRNRLETPVYRDASSQTAEEDTTFRLSWWRNDPATKTERILVGNSVDASIDLPSIGAWQVSILAIRQQQESIEISKIIDVI